MIAYFVGEMLTNGRRDISSIGKYRTHAEPMQVASGKYHEPIVHFEVPPSNIILKEMDRFIKWYNDTTDYMQLNLDCFRQDEFKSKPAERTA